MFGPTVQPKADELVIRIGLSDNLITRAADVMLFGAFLAWAIADFITSRKRDRAAGTTYPPGNGPRTVMTVVAGTAVWAVFAFWLHQYLIGVAPFA